MPLAVGRFCATCAMGGHEHRWILVEPELESPPTADEKSREKGEKKKLCRRKDSVQNSTPPGKTGQYENREKRQRVTRFAHQECG